MAETIREAYVRRNPKSAELYPKFREVFPTGVSHDMRVTDPFPLVLAHGQGARKWDVDGNEYIDYGLGSASLLLGHAHPAVVQALISAAPQGSHFGQPVATELEWGERVCSLIPCAEKVRFVASGAEATMLAMRIARGYTGKEKIVRWESHYHGWHDYAMPGTLPPFDHPASIGIPQGAVDSVIVLPLICINSNTCWRMIPPSPGSSPRAPGRPMARYRCHRALSPASVNSRSATAW